MKALPRSLVAASLSFWTAACGISTPFRGPGVRTDGHVALPEDQRVVVALTYAVLSDDRGPFDRYIGYVAEDMDAHAGLVGFSIGKRIFGNDVWTMSVWEDRRSLEDFVESDRHQQAIQAAGSAIVSLKTKQLELPAGEVPLTWERAFALLEVDATARGPRGAVGAGR
ncbi:MAG: hypothetical protein QNK05_11625 [Myxococcota bacterium]|nr:hypothetical protein [Myxococcota bacterium]